MSSPYTLAWLRMVAVCGLVVAADQAAKGAIVESLAPGERVDLLPGLDLVHFSNNGIAFGLLDDRSDALVFAITGVSLAAVGIWFAIDANRPGLWLGAGLLIGGALGNLVDRVRADAVTDFLDLVAWPAFNLADLAITVGVVLIAIRALSASAEPPAAPP